MDRALQLELDRRENDIIGDIRTLKTDISYADKDVKVDFIDESEVLTPADEHNHIWKHDYKVPFVCGCRNLGEALRRIAEGAAMIRTKGEAGSGNM